MTCNFIEILRNAASDHEDDYYDKSNLLLQAAKEIERLKAEVLQAQSAEPSNARDQIAQYILSDEYVRLLYRAVLSRLATSSNNKEKHIQALDLIKAAFPELTP